MGLTQAQVIKVGEWFKSRGVRGNCPGCGNKRWSIGGLISAPVTNALGVDTQAVPTMHSETVPAIATICNDCGYVMLFSSVMIGI